MGKIIIFDTTLRDGEQSPGASLTVKEKIIIAKQLAKLGVDIIEAGFPASSQGDFEAVTLIAKEIKNTTICALARTRKEDIDKAWEALKESPKPRIHTFIATSDIHLKDKLRKSKEEILDIVSTEVSYASTLCKDIEFSPEDAARTDLGYMCDVIKTAINSGATTINIPDTVGYSQPEEFGKRIHYVFEKLGHLIKQKGIIISVHCHNDLGLAVANSLEGIKNGATQIECTINGIGERAGNCSLEEAVMNIQTRKDFFKEISTCINLKEIFATSQLVASLTGISVQRNKAIVGQNAFAHEAGIHQHGVISNKCTYEIMNPQEIGWIGENLVLGKHSGRHAIETLLKQKGYDLNPEQIEEIIKTTKELADNQKTITHEDIIAIATDLLGDLNKDQQIIQLDKIEVSTGNKSPPTAFISIIINSENKSATAVGLGPVDAIKNAIEKIISNSIQLKDYTLKSITGGTNALADVEITVSDSQGNIFHAQSVNEDIIMASALALIKGINKAMNFAKSS